MNQQACINHLAGICNLRNRYFIMRHGESEANVFGIILSHPKKGIKGFGLSAKGKKQAEEAARKNKVLDKETIIYSSDFKRARETAQITRIILKAKRVHLTKNLRERWFGKWDETHHSNYEKVWTDDSKNSSHTNNEVESASSVQERTTALIVELEKKYLNKKILLVAHGDALQILQTGFLKENPSGHRNIKHLEVAEIRELKFKNKKRSAL